MKRRAVRRRSSLAAAAPFATALVAFTAWRAELPVVVVAALVLGLAHELAGVFRERRGGRLLGVHASGATLLAGLLVLAIAGSRAVLVMLPAGFAYLFVGLGLAQNAAVRERAARSLRRGRLPVDADETAAARDRTAIALVLPTCLLAVLLVPIATWKSPFRFGGGDDGAPPAVPPSADERAAPPSARGVAMWPDESAKGRPVSVRRVDGAPNPDEPSQVLLEARPTSRGMATGDLGPIYLRGLPLVEVDGRRRDDMSRLRDVQDPDDGQVDGWCEFAPRAKRSDAMLLAVHEVMPEIAPTGEVVVFCPPGAWAVELPAVRADPRGGVVARREPGVASFDYGVLAPLPARLPTPRTTTRVLGGDPRKDARRTAAPVPGTLEVAAYRASSDATNDLDRVRGVMRYLRDNFKYEQIDGRFDPVDGLLKFATERHGTCLQFAEAGVVMLRSLGIDSRIGRGYLLTEWDEDRRLYVARARDAHAWVEVEFEGCGFVVFDPTPRGADDAAGGPSPDDKTEKPPEAPIPPPVETPPAQDDGARLDQVVDDVRHALGSAWDWIAENPWPCLAVVVVAALLAVRAFDRRARRLSGEVVGAPIARGPWERLLADLARRGYRRRQSQTESEFAAAVVASGGDAFRPFATLVENRQATHFGGFPPSLDELREIETFRASL
jgi:transglutaminase-like putative cysteine protease